MKCPDCHGTGQASIMEIVRGVPFNVDRTVSCRRCNATGQISFFRDLLKIPFDPETRACLLYLAFAGFVVFIGYMFIVRPTAKIVAEKLQGSWAVIEFERGGRKTSVEDLKRMRVHIKGETILITEGDREIEKFTFKLDPLTRPRTIELVPDPAKEKRSSQGIYERDGDTMKLCWREEGDEQPTTFTSKPGDQKSVLMVLKKEKKD